MIKVEVIFMLHNEERHLIIQALNHHIPVKEIAECFSVNTSTIYRLRKQMERPVPWKPVPLCVAANMFFPMTISFILTA